MAAEWSCSRIFPHAKTFAVVAFYLTFAPVVLDRIYQQVHGSPLYALVLLHVMLTPLQGMFNLIIYRRHYMVRLREENPSWTWFQVLSKSLDNSSLQRLREFNNSRHKNLRTNATTTTSHHQQHHHHLSQQPAVPIADANDDDSSPTTNVEFKSEIE